MEVTKMTEDHALINAYKSQVIAAVEVLPGADIQNAVDIIWDCYEKGRTIFTCGNGGSAATASHFTGDIVKGLSHGDSKRFKSICLSDNLPGMMAVANDISYEHVFLEPLMNFLEPGDVVIGFSGSGNSPNVLKAIEYANENGAVTIGICGFGGGKLKQTAQHSVHAAIMDMEQSEDLHMFVVHLMKKIFMQRLGIPACAA